MSILAIPALWYIRTFPGSVDESFGLLDKLNLKSDITSDNWKNVENKMSELTPNQFSRVIMELCSGKLLNKEIEKFIDSTDSEFSNLIAGCYFISVAYIIRSGAWFRELDQDQVDGMYEYLEKAEEKLDIEFDNELYRLEASGRMMNILLNTGTIQDAAFFLERSRSIDESHWLSHSKFFRNSTPRWGGSNEDMIWLINSTDNEPLKVMLRLMTLVEMFDNLNNVDADSAVRLFKENRKELIEEALNNTVISENDFIVSIYAKNYLAMLYNILGMYKERDSVLAALDNRITRHPWAYYGILCERDLKVYKRFRILKFFN